MMLKQVTLCMLLLVTPMATGQSLQLVYIDRSGTQPGNNRINLECRRDGFPVPNPQIWVEQSDPVHRQNVAIAGIQGGRVAIEITQDLEGMYSCHYNGSRSTNMLKLVAYPQANYSIPLSYVFQKGQPATIDCRVMPGRLTQNYRVRWMDGTLSIATSNPRDVWQGYQLHDNFSLTINNIKPSDSSTSYQCIVTIDDPQIPGTDNIVYDQNQLGNITVMVNVLTPSTTPTVMFPTTPTVMFPTTPENTTGPPLTIILPAVLVPVLGMALFVLVCVLITILGCRAYRKSNCQAMAQGLRKKADNLENKILKLTQKSSRDPQQDQQIEDMRKEVKNLRDKANTKQKENQEMAEKLRKDAKDLEKEASEMEKELSSASREQKRQREKIISNKIKEAKRLRKRASCYDRMACDGDEKGNGQLEIDLEVAEDATCCNIPNPNTTTPNQTLNEDRV